MIVVKGDNNNAPHVYELGFGGCERPFLVVVFGIIFWHVSLCVDQQFVVIEMLAMMN